MQISSVQYLKFSLQGEQPSAIAVSHPKLEAEAELTEEQQKALSEDLVE